MNAIGSSLTWHLKPNRTSKISTMFGFSPSALRTWMCLWPFLCHRERDWKASSLGDTGDNLNQPHTRETELFVSTTQHCLVCNNDHQIASTMCVCLCMHVYVCTCACVRAHYAVKLVVRRHSPPKCHPTSTRPPLHTHTLSLARVLSVFTHIYTLFTQTHHSFRVFYEVSIGRQGTIQTLKARWVNPLTE